MEPTIVQLCHKLPLVANQDILTFANFFGKITSKLIKETLKQVDAMQAAIE